MKTQEEISKLKIDDVKKIIKIVVIGLMIMFITVFILMAIDELKTPTGRIYDNDLSWEIIYM